MGFRIGDRVRVRRGNKAGTVRGGTITMKGWRDSTAWNLLSSPLQATAPINWKDALRPTGQMKCWKKYRREKTMEKKTRIKDNKALEQLATLHVTHPDYPIIPMVDGDVVGDPDYGRTYWMGRLGESCIRKIYSGNKNVHEYDPDDEEEIYATLDDAPLKSGELEEAEEDTDYARELYNALPWQECIVVYIDTP